MMLHHKLQEHGSEPKNPWLLLYLKTRTPLLFCGNISTQAANKIVQRVKTKFTQHCCNSLKFCQSYIKRFDCMVPSVCIAEKPHSWFKIRRWVTPTVIPSCNQQPADSNNFSFCHHTIFHIFRTKHGPIWSGKTQTA